MKQKVWKLMCDICEREDNSETYVITPQGKPSKSIELCEEHAEPLLDLYAGASRRRSRKASREIASMDEIKAARLD